MNAEEATTNFQNDGKNVDISLRLNLQATEVSRENSKFSETGEQFPSRLKLILDAILYIVSLSLPSSVPIVITINNDYSKEYFLLITGIFWVVFLIALALVLRSKRNTEKYNKMHCQSKVMSSGKALTGTEVAQENDHCNCKNPDEKSCLSKLFEKIKPGRKKSKSK